MDITSNSTPMFSNENENNNNRNKDNKSSNSKSNDSKSNSKEERQLTDQDYELQALMFYYLKKRIEHNNSFNPTINIVTSKSKHNEKDLQRNEKQNQKSNDEQKKEVDAVKDFILKQHASEERKKKKDVDNDVNVDKGNKKNTNKSKDVTKALSEENKIFVTEISAFDPIDSALKTWSGPNIIAKSEEEADFLIQNTGLGYCKVIGELAGLIDTDGNDVKNAYRDN